MFQFKLAATSLEKIDLKKGLVNPRTGAFNSFEGLVRNHNHGRRVVALEYEALPALCAKEIQKIFKEARKKFKIIHTRCFHRVGILRVGEMAVWVGVCASHRDQAFLACRYIIDEVKKRLPIWKKEYYKSGNSGWVNACHK